MKNNKDKKKRQRMRRKRDREELRKLCEFFESSPTAGSTEYSEEVHYFNRSTNWGVRVRGFFGVPYTQRMGNLETIMNAHGPLMQ